MQDYEESGIMRNRSWAGVKEEALLLAPHIFEGRTYDGVGLIS